jgi:hypothetical protein
MLFFSCDKHYYGKMYIVNNCEEIISVLITNTWNNVQKFDVGIGSTYLFDDGEGITPTKKVIEHSFTEFKVVKNGIESKVNYLKVDRWQIIYEDEFHSSAYLTINPEDFE